MEVKPKPKSRMKENRKLLKIWHQNLEMSLLEYMDKSCLNLITKIRQKNGGSLVIHSMICQTFSQQLN